MSKRTFLKIVQIAIQNPYFMACLPKPQIHIYFFLKSAMDRSKEKQSLYNKFKYWSVYELKFKYIKTKKFLLSIRQEEIFLIFGIFLKL